ncbi:hypothetical protein KDA_72890 [Dictyobacter alpinus]|uniref:Methyltransferase domain-containing protein n=1 Tax=Dictyobacter alpinus TaxID=2014873 RepID=A0A402BKC8_9CHLR|nr:class I SAM-dependent methyltransferase [Dictyobacter alpinus]GCE31805.1 hypothetical protein KDA_72890 [Dictyobacter alpinus]
MEPKPSHLGLKYAEQFQDRSIVDVYHHRAPYADTLIETLINLVIDEPRVVLDVGCGTGDLARRLVHGVERVDAVDFSPAMLEKGRSLPNGDHPGLRWLYGRVEEIALQPAYALITAGESLHWMEWDIVCPLFERLLTPNGYLVIAGRGFEKNPWDTELFALINEFSTNKEFKRYNLIDELERRELFEAQGSFVSAPVSYIQDIEAYLKSYHSRNGLSRERMGDVAADRFDEGVREIIGPYTQDGFLTLSIVSSMVWGQPGPGFVK